MFMYSDIVHVEAEDESQAESIALGECDEQYESYYDCDISEEDDDENEI